MSFNRVDGGQVEVLEFRRREDGHVEDFKD